MTNTFSIGDDTIDSRDIIERIKDLESSVEDGTASEEEQEELKGLKEFAEEVAPMCPDWADGATLIEESYFEDYAKELVEDTNPEVADLPWWVVVNWTETADNMQQDYACADIDGTTYWFRT